MASRLFGLRVFKPQGSFILARFASTEAVKSAAKSTVSKATSAASSLSSKATGSINCATVILKDAYAKTVYGSKVGFEIAKEVYEKEHMAPPNAQQLEEAKKELFSLAKLDTINKFDKIQFYKTAYYGTQIYGFFLVGEIIGRFNIVGYNV